MGYHSEKRHEMINWTLLVIALFVVIMSLIIMTYLSIKMEVDKDIKIETDRIAACTKTDDVVNCLNALKEVE